MFTARRLAAVAALAAASLVASGSTLATADNLGLSPDPITASPGTNVQFTAFIVATSDGTDLNGCNVNTGSGNAATLTFTSSNTAVADAPAPVTITGCDDTNTSGIEGGVLVTVPIKSGATQSSSTRITVAGSGGRAAGGGKSAQYSSDFLDINVQGKVAQAPLTVLAASPQTYSTTQTLATTGGTGTGAVTYATSTPSVCSVTGAVLTMDSGTGSCSVTATKAGDALYNPTTSSAAVVTAQKLTPILTLSAPGTATFGDAPQVVTATASPANGTLVVSSTTPAVCSYSAGQATIVGTGTCTLSASQAADANLNALSTIRSISVARANTLTTLSCASSVVYTGAARTPCAATVTGPGLNQSLTPTYANNTNVGTASASALYGGSGNYNGSEATRTFAITPATTQVSVTCPTSRVFDNTDQEPCTATVTGDGGLNEALTVLYANNHDAGTASASASYAGDANHSGATGSATFAITPAATTVTLSCPTAAVYTGNAQTPCSAAVSGPGLTQSLTPSYTGNTNVGTATASAAYAGGDNYQASSNSTTFEITKAGTTTTVSCPANRTYTGTAIEPCTAQVTGAADGVKVPVVHSNNVHAGTAQAAAHYEPDADHLESDGLSTFTIQKATSSTVVSCSESAVYTGSALELCSAAVTGAGGLSLSDLVPSYTDNVVVGEATASYAFDGDDDHLGSKDSDTFDITKAPTTTTVSCPSTVGYDGSPQTPCSANVAGAGGLSETLTVNYTDNTDAGTASASASYGGDANHTESNDAKTFEITKAASFVSVVCDPASVQYDGTPQTPCTATATGVGGLKETLTVSYADNTDVGDATASAKYAGDANHKPASGNTTFAITPAPSTTVVTCSPTTVTYSGTAQTPCTAQVTGVGGLTQSVPLTYLNNVNAGQASASATFTGDRNHTGSTGSAFFTIDKAESITTVTCTSPVTFTGTGLTPCSAGTTGAGGLTASPAVSYTNNVHAGTAQASATYFGDDNHTGSTGTSSFVIDPAASTTVVTCPASVTYNGSAQTPCSAAASGAGLPSTSVAPVVYNNNVEAGTASATATYAGDADHTGSTGSATFTIAKAGSTTVVTCPATVTWTGSALTPCTALVTGAGGLNQAAPVTYANNTNPGTATATASFAGDSNHASSAGGSTFSIQYGFHGFFQPIDTVGGNGKDSTVTAGTVFNKAKAGSAIPVKFDLGGNAGLNIFASGYPKTQTVSCSSAALTDAVEETSTASGLKYDGTTNLPYGQYNYTWKTPTTFAGTCQRLEVKFVDGTSRFAFFQFTK